jgi:hypothetical protein
MKIKDEAFWSEIKENNKEPYSLAVVKYTERWANLMEKELEKGNTVADIAKETSHEADTDGITGFMYGCAVSFLSKVWEHGEELRVWHNKKYGIENKEGVVNPAILTIKG